MACGQAWGSRPISQYCSGMSSSAVAPLASPLAALPPDAILVHIGMRKTGTTAMQSLLAAAREDLHTFGVRYPGTKASHHIEARSLLRRPDGRLAKSDRAVPTLEAWEDLAAEARGSNARVVISSEFLSYAKAADVQRLVDDLGRDRLRIIVGVRDLAPVAMSSWQQDLKTGMYVHSLDRWMENNFRRAGEPADAPSEDNDRRTFWDLSDVGAIVSRWAEAIGPERTYVVVMKNGDRAQLPTTFEQLLDLPAGTLASRDVKTANRSMTDLEAEFVRRVNVAVRGKLEWPEYTSLIRYGMVHHLVETRSPAPGEEKPVLPDWALAETAEANSSSAKTISDLGVHIVGDLADLTPEVGSAGGTAELGGSIDGVPMDAAVEAVVGIATKAARESRAIRARAGKQRAAPPPPAVTDVDKLGGRALTGLLVKRVRISIRRRISTRVARLRGRKRRS